jgi:hypothetical protein
LRGAPFFFLESADECRHDKYGDKMATLTVANWQQASGISATVMVTNA